MSSVVTDLILGVSNTQRTLPIWGLRAARFHCYITFLQIQTGFYVPLQFSILFEKHMIMTINDCVSVSNCVVVSN